ncbi:dethiobiotin synthase [Mariniblastus fucicola]|uniref:ATP-dependent dethiobiotin synthetase BioD n=1 Tax=Mariniblastus fucicola TaxID=980251 RepID=A0A5B9PEE0_9BACT|nr:dethiobiotin synthase [Mariniblastus fucicola]QEG24604.1 ATP-dependent dethiobiotin synthetase BioD 1 [Mariniblastus fucicola]
MTAKPPYGLFVTGTDTEIGKTWVSTIIVRDLVKAGYRVGVYKPLASDSVSDGQNNISEDALQLWEAAGQPLTTKEVCPQCFQAPLSPHLAARAEGREVDSELVRSGIEAWADFDIVVVEGCGGLMSPVDDESFFADVAQDFGFPVLIVVDNRIGAINQGLQATIAANCYGEGLDVAGLILNDSQAFQGDQSRDSNFDQIASRSIAPVLTRVRYDAESCETEVDWMAIARREVVQPV